MKRMKAKYDRAHPAADPPMMEDFQEAWRSYLKLQEGSDDEEEINESPMDIDQGG